MNGRGDRRQGGLDEAKGKIKQAWGDFTDDEETRAEGQRDGIKGKGQQTLGHLKDAGADVRKGFDKDHH